MHPRNLLGLQQNLNHSKKSFTRQFCLHSSFLSASCDRYRKGLKGTWKDQPLPAAGSTWDLGSHLIDQALNLFGRPNRLTAFIQNLRQIGNASVDDTVCRVALKIKVGTDEHGLVYNPYALRRRAQACVPFTCHPEGAHTVGSLATSPIHR